VTSWDENGLGLALNSTGK